MTYNKFNSSFEGIIDAVVAARIEQGFGEKFYPSSYEGIVAAIRGLAKDLSGANPTPYPPGWVPEINQDGDVIGGDFQPGFTPAAGDLWFDTRQGRLMIFVDDGYYQCNGADVLTVVQEDTPTGAVEGALWYQPSTESLYLWTGLEWKLISSSLSNTATLMLAQPTRTASYQDSVLPPTDGLTTQSDFNIWAVSALDALDTNRADPGSTVYVSETPPPESVPGDLWFNTVILQMFVEYDGFWIPTSIPLVQDPNFLALSSTVTALQATYQGKFQASDARITALELTPAKQYTVGASNSAITLSDDEGAVTTVPVTGEHGISVLTSNGSLAINGSALESRIAFIENNFATGSDKADLVERDAELLEQLNALANEPKVDANVFNALQATVAALPTTAYVDTKLSTNGGTLTGSLSLSNKTITNLGEPQYQTDAARLADITLLETHVASTYVPKTNAVFNGLDVQRDDVGKSGIKFVNGAAGGMRAIELKTMTSQANSTVVFGQTPFPNEVAWEFHSGENFSWKDRNAGKQLRIDANGVVASALSIGDMVRGGDGNELILNKIDVKERLQAYQASLNGIRSALLTSTSFEEFKQSALTSLTGL